MMFVVPKVVEQVDTMGQTLPLLTRIVMGLSQFLAGWWWALLLGIGVLAGLGWRALREAPIRYAADREILDTPTIGRLLRDLHAARMARTPATMVDSRLPLIERRALPSRTLQHRVLKPPLVEIVETIRGGGSLSRPPRQ